MRNISLCALLLACLVAPLSAQNIVTIGDGTNTNGSFSYPAPFGAGYESARHQIILLASELTGIGIGAGDINAIGFDVTAIGTSGLHDGFTISLGTTTATDLSGGFEAGLAPVTTPVDYQPVVGTNLITLVAPFAWDGTSNLVIETCFDSSVVSGFTINATHNRTDVGYTSCIWVRDDGSSQCGLADTNASALRPNIVLDVSNFSVPVPDWQVNQAEATTTINGVTGTASTLAEVTICTNEVADLDISTTLTTQPFDLVVWQGLPLDSSTTGLVTGDNQVIHFDSSSPFFLFFVGGASFNFTTPFQLYPLPFPFSFSTPFTAQAGLQSFHIDPSGAGGDFVRMSQPTSLTISDGGLTVDLGNGDDQVTELVFDSSPLCGPATVEFYGASYTNCFASSNGRVSFIAGDNDFSVSTAEALTDTPFVGAWQDLSPNLGGTWEAVATGSSVNISWNGVEYYRNASDPMNPTVDFSIDFFATGAVALNLTNLPIGTDDAFIGVSPGDDDMTGTTPNPATDPGAAAFLPGAFNTAPVAGRDMIYEFGGQGTLAPGVGTIIFTPNGAGNYNWVAY